ncbi:hypothetical protein COOONC_11599 [Cooperia oncophora]
MQKCCSMLLNLMAIARSENRAGRSQRSDLYIEQAMEVLSFGVEANVTRRKERFLRWVLPRLTSQFKSLTKPMVHNFHRFLGGRTSSADLPRNEVCPALMGPKLTTEIVEKSQCRKLTEALVKEAKAKRTHGSGKKMKTYTPKRERSVYEHIIRAEKQLAPYEESEAGQGYRLEFSDQIPQCSLQSCTTDSESDLLSVAVQEMLDKNAIEEIPWSSEVWTSKIFVIPKKDGGNRTIINLKPLNSSKRYPSGLSSAPYVFTRLMRAIASELRSRGIRLIVYLGDWIDNRQKQKISFTEDQTNYNVTQNLGLTINEKKSQLEPSQVDGISRDDYQFIKF